MPPRVSVIIPVHNPGPLLEVCLASATRQTYENLEIVPVDDAGEEPVRERIEAVAHGDARLKPVFHATNLGLAGALNSGLRNSTGEYVLVLEQDCALERPDAIARAVELISTETSRCLTGVRTLPFDEMRAVETAFAVISSHLPESHAEELVPASFSELKCDLFPREALHRAGGFDETFRFSGEDQMLAHRLKGAGFRIFRTTALGYTLRSGKLVTARTNLRREFTYGRTQAALVLSTRMSSLGTTAVGEHGGRRFANRIHGISSGFCLLLLPLLFLLIGLHVALLVLLASPVSRIILVAARARRALPRGPGASRALALAAALTPVDDVVYAVAFGVGLIMYAVTRRA